MGDNIYGDSEDMSVLKAKYKVLGEKNGFKKLRERAVIMATWDDHDYGLNDGGAGFVKREASQQLFQNSGTMYRTRHVVHGPVSMMLTSLAQKENVCR